jgi:hypothetical protein
MTASLKTLKTLAAAWNTPAAVPTLNLTVAVEDDADGHWVVCDDCGDVCCCATVGAAWAAAHAHGALHVDHHATTGAVALA